MQQVNSFQIYAFFLLCWTDSHYINNLKKLGLYVLSKLILSKRQPQAR